MKTLHLVRHAKSSWDDPFADDFDRPLNNRGRADAPRMAKRLKERAIHPDMLLSSPAARALSTCRLMAEKLGYDNGKIHTDDRLYHSTEDELKNVIHELNDANDEVMIFSHNPGLTDFANSLSKKPFTENIPTCGVVSISFNVNSWRDVQWGTGRLILFDFPKKH